MGVFKTSQAFESLRNMAVWVIRDGDSDPIWHVEPESGPAVGSGEGSHPSHKREQGEVSFQKGGGPPRVLSMRFVMSKGRR